MERLEDVGYEFVPYPEVATAELNGLVKVAVLGLGRDSNLEEMGAKFQEQRQLFPDCEWIAIFSGRLRVKAHILHEKGFNQIYQIPLDEELFTNRIFELLPLVIEQKELKFEHLLRVNVPLLKDVEIAGFDIFMYLPSNRRIMLYLREGFPVDSAKLEKFEKNRNHALFIRKSDIKKYKDYSTSALRKINANSSLSDDAKIDLVQENIQIMMTPFFSEGEMTDEEGRQTVIQLQGMLKGLQVGPPVSKESLVSLEKLAAQKMTNASHSNNVAVYCAMFGIAMGLKNIDELRLGGLLHDVGLADLPMELIGKDEQKMSDEDRARYHLHPGNGRTDVINRNVRVSETVQNMILFHHERPDGSGYPYGKKADEIPVEAQICGFADEFDKLTSFREGYPCYTPKEALRLLSGQLGQPAARVFNPDVHQKIVDFYLKEEEASVLPADHGQVIARRIAGEVERKSLSHPVALSSLHKKMPPANVDIDAESDAAIEIQVLEKELEFYFFEKA